MIVALQIILLIFTFSFLIDSLVAKDTTRRITSFTGAVVLLFIYAKFLI